MNARQHQASRANVSRPYEKSVDCLLGLIFLGARGRQVQHLINGTLQ